MLRRAWAAVILVLSATGAVAVVLAWRAADLRREWLIGAALGMFLLAVAAVFDAVLLSRSRRPLDVAHGALRMAAQDLGSSYAALAAANAELRQTAAARDRALTDLRAAVRERETFLAAISHDLKTPLTLINGNAQLLLAADGAMSERLRVRLASIEASASEMAVLIDELLELASMETGRVLDLERRPTDLVDLARQSVREHALAANMHRLRLATELPELVGEWDPVRLKRVLDNLLSNAVKYSGAASEIVVSVTRDEARAHAVLTVRDNGIGIPAAELPRIFERFYRASNIAGRLAGTGLGLAGALYTVEAHGGTIDVESKEGAGSAFTVRLPLAPPAPPPPDTGLATEA